MARQKWTRTEAVQYLAGSGFRFKEGHHYTDAYLKRTASSYKKQQEAGQKPSLSAARGHAQVRHIPRQEGNYQAGQGKQRPPRPEQYSIGNKARPASKKDIEHLREYAEKPPKARKGQPQRTPMRPRPMAGGEMRGGGLVSGNVTGILAQDYNAYKLAGDEVTLSFKVSVNDWNAIMAQATSPAEAANMLMGQSYPTVNAVFSQVFSVNILS